MANKIAGFKYKTAGYLHVYTRNPCRFHYCDGNWTVWEIHMISFNTRTAKGDILIRMKGNLTKN